MLIYLKTNYRLFSPTQVLLYLPTQGAVQPLCDTHITYTQIGNNMSGIPFPFVQSNQRRPIGQRLMSSWTVHFHWPLMASSLNQTGPVSRLISLVKKW